MYTLEQAPASEPAPPPGETTSEAGKGDDGAPDDVDAVAADPPAAGEDSGANGGPGPQEPAPSTDTPVETPTDAPAAAAPDRDAPSDGGSAAPAPPASSPPVDDEPRPLWNEPQPLEADTPAMAAFQREVVALPPGYESTLFSPAGHEHITIAQRSTDRLTHGEVVDFMRRALAAQGWQIDDQRDVRRDLVHLDASRGEETVEVRVLRFGAGPDGADVVYINVEHEV